MILPGLVLWCPFLPLDTAAFSSLTGRWRVFSYGVWYCCAPSRPVDAAVVSRLDEVIEGMILRGRVLLCPVPHS